jgi:hypothetical protein
MPNALYAKGKEKLLGSTNAISLDVDTIKVALVNNAYPQDLALDEWYTTLSTYVLNTPQTLTNKSITNGIFDADDVTFSAVAAGSTCEGVVIYKDTGTPGSSALLAYIDTITGFPLATNGGDITIQWDNGAFRIFSL